MRLLKELEVDVNGVKECLHRLFNGSEIITSVTNEVKYLAVCKSNKIIFDLRLTNNVAEIYINLALGEFTDDLLKMLSIMDLKVVSEGIRELIRTFGTTPKSITISRVLPSNSIYILLEPNNELPPAKGVCGINGVSVITPRCTTYGYDVKCGEGADLKLTKIVLNILRDLCNP